MQTWQQTTARRRQAVRNDLGKGEALLLPGARLARRNGDSDHPFRQHSDFLWLTGFTEPDALCVLRGDGDPGYVLFVPPRDPAAETWTGRRAGVEGAVSAYGADAAHPLEEIDARLPELLSEIHTLYYAFGVDAVTDQRVLDLVRAHRASRPRRGHGIVRIVDPTMLLHERRLRKDAFEIERLRHAATITTAAHLRVLRRARAGMHEYELQAMLESTFRARGGSGPAYGTIVGSGANATVLHYIANRDVLAEGDLVLVDAGAEVDGYACDVTRTFPVSARFTPEQRTLYAIVLEAQEAALEAVRPGNAFDAAHRRALERLAQGLVELGWVEGPVARVIESGDYKPYYMHRTGHWLGLDVHDVGTYVDPGGGSPRRLEPGMVVTVEPGLYVSADDPKVPEAFRGLGIRIEDDVLVTAEGADVLTAAIPKAVEAIETLRGRATAPVPEETA